CSVSSGVLRTWSMRAWPSWLRASQNGARARLTRLGVARDSPSGDRVPTSCDARAPALALSSAGAARHASTWGVRLPPLVGQVLVHGTDPQGHPLRQRPHRGDVRVRIRRRSDVFLVLPEGDYPTATPPRVLRFRWSTHGVAARRDVDDR